MLNYIKMVFKFAGACGVAAAILVVAFTGDEQPQAQSYPSETQAWKQDGVWVLSFVYMVPGEDKVKLGQGVYSREEACLNHMDKDVNAHVDQFGHEVYYYNCEYKLILEN